VVWGIIAINNTAPYKFVCNPTVISGGEGDKGHVDFAAHIFWMFYAQKFWEFLDTWFFIARKSFRQVTFLHVFHHCSINIVVGLLLPFDFSGDMYLPILLNAIVHVLMYGHYLVAALGLPTPWKPWLTSIQLTQFITIATQSTLSLSRGDSCGAPYFGKVLMVTYMGSMLILFGNFFYHSYILKKPTARFGDGVIKKLEPLQVTTTHTGRSLLDEAGNASVELPSAFASGDLSYQVTPIGGPMPQLHVASEPSEEKCSFALAGGSGGRSVSWTVTKVMTIAGEAPPKPPPSCCGNPQEQAGTKKTK
jgi:elongation of very long chain fatty acids protein 4